MYTRSHWTIYNLFSDHMESRFAGTSFYWWGMVSIYGAFVYYNKGTSNVFIVSFIKYAKIWQGNLFQAFLLSPKCLQGRRSVGFCPNSSPDP